MPLTTVDQGLLSTNAQYTGFKNRLINGDMVVDQRNNGSAVTGQQYLVDRWRTWFDPGTYSFQQVADAPAGFTNSLRVTKTNTTQSNYGILLQHIEGFNIADLSWGTANAQTVTLSFWVKSSITGTFSASLNNADTATRSYIIPYTVTSANTWEYKTATVPGPTSGTWGSTNGTGIQVKFNYGGGVASGAGNTWLNGDFGVATGATANLGTTNGATFQITGCQLERGQTATSFDVLPYTTELALCQRYYWRANSSGGVNNIALGQIVSPTTRQYFFFQYPVPMRATPSSIDAASLVVTPYYGVGGIIIFTIAIDTNTIGSQYANLVANGAASAGSTQGLCMLTTSSGNAGYVGFNAEL
jgi:hypothetical protein